MRRSALTVLLGFALVFGGMRAFAIEPVEPLGESSADKPAGPAQPPALDATREAICLMVEAAAKANALPVSFQAAVFTRDIDTAMHCYRQLNGTAIMVNDHTAFRVDWMPFAAALT